MIALDKDDRPVTDLKAEELRLFEDKVELKIQGLSSTVNEPLTVGLIFDVSGSRRTDVSIPYEMGLASQFVHSIWREGDSGFVLAFNEQMHALVQPTKKVEDIDLGLRKVAGAPYLGSTALYDALCNLGPKTLAAIPGRKVYVVFSDFDDNASRNRPEHAVEIARKGGVLIFPMVLPYGFGSGTPRKGHALDRLRVQEIADQTGGEVLIPESPKDLAQLFQHLAADLHSTYQIIYDPSSAALQKKGRRSKFRIETTRERTKLIYPKS